MQDLCYTALISEMGKYPFGKILIAAAYMHNCALGSLYNKTKSSFTVLRYNNEFME